LLLEKRVELTRVPTIELEDMLPNPAPKAAVQQVRFSRLKASNEPLLWAAYGWFAGLGIRADKVLWATDWHAFTRGDENWAYIGRPPIRVLELLEDSKHPLQRYCALPTFVQSKDNYAWVFTRPG